MSLSVDWTATRFPMDAGRRDIMVLSPDTTQSKAYTGTAGVIDNAISANCQIVRVYCTTAAHIRFGSSPTAVTTDMPVAANTAEYFLVPTPGTSKVSAIRQAADGTLFVTECL